MQTARGCPSSLFGVTMDLTSSCRKVMSMKTSPPSFPTITHEENRFVQYVLPHLSQGLFLYVRNMSSGLTTLSALSNFEGMTWRMIYIPIDRARFQNSCLGAVGRRAPQSKERESRLSCRKPLTRGRNSKGFSWRWCTNFQYGKERDERSLHIA